MTTPTTPAELLELANRTEGLMPAFVENNDVPRKSAAALRELAALKAQQPSGAQAGLTGRIEGIHTGWLIEQLADVNGPSWFTGETRYSTNGDSQLWSTVWTNNSLEAAVYHTKEMAQRVFISLSAHKLLSLPSRNYSVTEHAWLDASPLPGDGGTDGLERYRYQHTHKEWWPVPKLPDGWRWLTVGENAKPGDVLCDPRVTPVTIRRGFKIHPQTHMVRRKEGSRPSPLPASEPEPFDKFYKLLAEFRNISPGEYERAKQWVLEQFYSATEPPPQKPDMRKTEFWKRATSELRLVDLIEQLERCPVFTISEAEDWVSYLRAIAPMLGQGKDAWQPIATAPKDGRTLLLGYFNELGKWRTVRGQWYSKDQIDQEWEDPDGDEGWYETAVEADLPNCWWIKPTHWMPLPDAPK